MSEGITIDDIAQAIKKAQRVEESLNLMVTNERHEGDRLRAERNALKDALAGLEPSDVATLVGLVRRYYAGHETEARAGCPTSSTSICCCDDCSAARPLLARLPK